MKKKFHLYILTRDDLMQCMLKLKIFTIFKHLNKNYMYVCAYTHIYIHKYQTLVT